VIKIYQLVLRVYIIPHFIGDIIGSGIFVSPSAILNHSQSVGLSLVIWVLGCLIAAIGCLIYVELGTKIRKSGCDFGNYLIRKFFQLNN
jgi:amino acid transporter